MTSTLEVAANVVGTLSILLAGRNSVHTWWTGIVGCSLFACVFFQSRLYADVVLQFFFVATSAVGWWQWLKGDGGRPLIVGQMRAGTLLRLMPLGAVAALAYGAMLHACTDAYAPFVDSAVLAFSVVAQLLLMQRRIEAWPFWLLVNTLAVPLYASRGLYLTCGLYAFYWINAAWSWWWWRRIGAAMVAERKLGYE